MISKLQSEIRQKKPFANTQEELWLNLSRTSAAVGHTIEQKLRCHALSPTQYNVLRILRGAGADGLSQSDIGLRLVAQVPDVPRILDRMERAQLVRRERSGSDRRVMVTTLTEAGLELVSSLDQPMVEVMAGLFGAMKEDEMARLNELLVAARS